MSRHSVSNQALRKHGHRFGLDHRPLPVTGISASHRELRLALGALRVVAHDPVAPAVGNGLWAIARRAVADLDRALVRHLGEPHPLPASTALQADLEGQHTALVVLAVALSTQLACCREGHGADWQALRALTGRVIDRLESHLELEERLVATGATAPNRTPSPSIA